MRARAAPVVAVVAVLAAASAHAQAPSAPDRAAIAHGLFGEDEPEPGDEDVAAGRVEPPATPSPSTATPADAYDTRVRSSFRAAESFQGPLEGGWTLAWRGHALYRLRFADHAGKLEGVWSESSAPRRSGMVGIVRRTPGRLRIGFLAGPGEHVTADLRRVAAHAWTGRLRRADETFDHVKMTKTSP